MLFYSTNNRSEPVSLQTALLNGLAPDKGLYLPSEYPVLKEESFSEFSSLTYPELASRILYPFFAEAVSQEECLTLAKRAYNFDIPLERLDNQISLMRLDRGPTHSFKDFGARMMALLLEKLVWNSRDKLVILTATSGDTGSAIGNAFYGIKNIEVVILFPAKEITDLQRKQMTTLGGNIHTISIDGKFDDCQALVKEAFTDPRLDPLHLTSANSINIGRLLPQSVYYFYAYLHSGSVDSGKIIFSIPSGNFGNACGCLIAKRMGLPVSRLLLPTNSNDSFPQFLRTGKYKKIVPSISCISSAMNVGHPSNLARIITLYGGNMDETGDVLMDPDLYAMRQDIYSVSISDEETRLTIRKAYQDLKILLEPHGAVGLAGLERYLSENQETITPDEAIVTIETAHPAKFPDEIQNILSIDPDPPDSFANLVSIEENFESLYPDYQQFREYLLDKIKI